MRRVSEILGRIERSSEDGIAVVTLVGEFDLSNAVELVDMLESLTPDPGQRRRVVLDVAGMDYMDSTALNVLVFGRAHGLDLTLRGLHGRPRRIIEVAGLLHLFELED